MGRANQKRERSLSLVYSVIETPNRYLLIHIFCQRFYSIRVIPCARNLCLCWNRTQHVMLYLHPDRTSVYRVANFQDSVATCKQLPRVPRCQLGWRRRKLLWDRVERHASHIIGDLPTRDLAICSADLEACRVFGEIYHPELVEVIGHCQGIAHGFD